MNRRGPQPAWWPIPKHFAETASASAAKPARTAPSFCRFDPRFSAAAPNPLCWRNFGIAAFVGINSRSQLEFRCWNL
jgi:hypothetical protein